MLYLKDVVYHPPLVNPILQGINLELAPQELGLIVCPVVPEKRLFWKF
jgi:energy-coupling factor transport system ATP-binding protein